MFNKIKEFIGFETIIRNEKIDEENAQMIADIDMTFYISEDGALSRDSNDNFKNKKLMEIYADTSKFIKR